MTDKPINVILGYKTDTASAKRAIKSLDDLEREIASVEKAALLAQRRIDQFGRVGVSSADDLRKAMRGVGASATDIDRAADAFKRLQREAAKARTETKGQLSHLTTDGGRVGTGLSAAGGLFNDLGVGGAGLQTAGQAFDVAEAFSAPGASLAQMLKIAGPVAAALIAVNMAMDNYNKTLEASKSAVNSAIISVKTYYTAISTGTTETIQKQINELKAQRDIVDAQNRDITLAYLLAQQSGDTFVVALGRMFNSFKEVEDEINGLNKESNGLTGQIDGLERALTSSQVAANDAAQAERELAEERKKWLEESNRISIQWAQDEVRVRHEANQRIASSTAEQVQGRIDAIQQEKRRIEEQIQAIYNLGTPTEAAYDAIHQLSRQMSLLDIEAKELSKSLPGLRSLMNGFAERWNQATSATAKFNEDQKRINEQALERRADLEKRYADRQIEIVQNAVRASQKALADLERAQAEANRDFARDSAREARANADEDLQARVEAARVERDELVAHLRNLQEIRRRDQFAEQDATFNRDFLALFNIRRQRAFDIESANLEFGQGQADRAQAEADRAEVAARERASEARERAIAFQEKIADLRLNYQLERAVIEAQRVQALNENRAARTRELTELQSNLARQLAERKKAWQAELQMITSVKAAATGATATIQAAAATVIRSIARSIPGIGALFGGRRAEGGSVLPNRIYSVNESGSSGRESVTSGGRTFGFPGPGLFIPSTSAYVNANRGDTYQINGLSIPVYAAPGQDANQIASTVWSMFMGKLKQEAGVS